MAKKNNKTDNQTQFNQESVILEDKQEELLFEPKPVQTDQPFYKTKKGLMMLIAGFIFLLIVTLIVVAVLVKNKADQSDQLSLPKKKPSLDQPNGPLQQELNQLKLRLELADPSKKELPFPQVKLEINLEQD